MPETDNIQMPGKERTSAQVFHSPGKLGDAVLTNVDKKQYKTYRLMRSDPTIAFARMLTVAPLVAAGWVYKGKDSAPPDAQQFIEEQFEPLRVDFMKQVLEGYIDYGWAGFEMVLCYDERWGTQNLKMLKPLLQSYTDILVDEDTGEFLGLRQDIGEKTTDLSVHGDCVHVALDVEGTNWYGRPLMENARMPYEKWTTIEAAAARYDEKIAGSHLVVHYPVGTSPFEGVDMDNFLIAKKIIAAFEASGKIAVPVKMVQYGDSADNSAQDAWKLELLNDGGQSKGAFIDRQKYLDALKVRAFGIPERAILEGQFGTKAESESQADFAIVNMELRHSIITQQVSRRPVNYLLDLNYGKDAVDTVCIEPKPLTDVKKALYLQIYQAFLADPTMLSQESQVVDLSALKEHLGIPEREMLEQEIGAGGLLSEYFGDGSTGQGLLGEYFQQPPASGALPASAAPTGGGGILSGYFPGPAEVNGQASTAKKY